MSRDVIRSWAPSSPSIPASVATREVRRLDDVLSMSLEELEGAHDYNIQWLFPLYEPSGANPAAPVLEDAAAGQFCRDQVLRRAVRRSLDVMLAFYGLDVRAERDTLQVVRTPAYEDRATTRLTPWNYNFMRLNRILRSLGILGAGPVARALHSLEGVAREYPGAIREPTLEYWRGAVAR